MLVYELLSARAVQQLMPVGRGPIPELWGLIAWRDKLLGQRMGHNIGLGLLELHWTSHECIMRRASTNQEAGELALPQGLNGA